MFDEDILYKAPAIFIRCPFCGRRENLKVRKATTFVYGGKARNSFYSIHCEACRLAYGEIDGEPVFETEIDLTAAWNVRAY